MKYWIIAAATVTAAVCGAVVLHLFQISCVVVERL